MGRWTKMGREQWVRDIYRRGCWFGSHSHLWFKPRPLGREGAACVVARSYFGEKLNWTGFKETTCVVCFFKGLTPPKHAHGWPGKTAVPLHPAARRIPAKRASDRTAVLLASSQTLAEPLLGNAYRGLSGHPLKEAPPPPGFVFVWAFCLPAPLRQDGGKITGRAGYCSAVNKAAEQGYGKCPSWGAHTQLSWLGWVFRGGADGRLTGAWEQEGRGCQRQCQLSSTGERLSAGEGEGQSQRNRARG